LSFSEIEVESFDENEKKGKFELEEEKENKFKICPFFENVYVKDDKLIMSGFIPKRLGDFILSKMHFKTIRGNDKMYFYEDGIYKDGGKETIKKMCKDILGEKFKASFVNEVITYIQASTYAEPNSINNEYVNLENGLLNPVTKEFLNHTPDIFSILRTPIKYDPSADCPLFKEKLSAKVGSDIFDTTQEMFGYCFMPGQKYEKAFLLYGGKRTMKSTVLYVLNNLIGKENVTSLPLQQIASDPFATGYLLGIPANICADLTSQSLSDTGKFLMITGGDSITAGKKHEHLITFYPNTKLIFSCNVIPPTSNKNPAFYRRWILLNYSKQTPEEEVDSDMKIKLLEELPGILNWALDGLNRLIKNGKFTFNPSPEEVKDAYERNSDTIQSFIFNEINTEDDEGVLTKRETFKRYIEYCRQNELQPENVIKFGRMFIALTGCGTCQTNKIPAYKGVGFKGQSCEKQTTIEW
jgi:putative DNA primase/helicase